MTTWNYTIGNEKDFEDAPDWASMVMEFEGQTIFEEHVTPQIGISRFSIKGGKSVEVWSVDTIPGGTIIAQREPVATNDNRPRSIHHPDGTVQFGCIQTPLIDVDMVNHPSHYTQGSIECIDAIKAATVGKTGIEAVCVANVIKYLWRYEEKNGPEDVKKARWYLERLINELNGVKK